MRKTRILFVSLLAVFAVGAIASASASAAPLWIVAGNKAFGSEALQETPITIIGGKLTGDSIEITCPKLKIVGGLITEGTTGMATSATFTECKESVESTKCELGSSTIGTNPGSADIANSEEIEVLPSGTTEFTKVELVSVSGKTCAKRGEFVISGSARLKVAEAASEKTEHELELSSASALKINGNTATIAGKGKGGLTSLKVWAISPT